ncbi:MAG: GIY-YIG nuclease family protein [Betaproteobacteria bacterium]|nr:GIY-YIG nuclease family protein [Betaproteobacteria bacterium]
MQPMDPSQPRPAKLWYLYLIECRDGSLYTGITTDVAARYQAHCAGKGARYTRSHPPARLLGWEPHPDRSAAAKAEYRVKQLSAAEKRLLATGLQKLAENCG